MIYSNEESISLHEFCTPHKSFIILKEKILHSTLIGYENSTFVDTHHSTHNTTQGSLNTEENFKYNS